MDGLSGRNEEEYQRGGKFAGILDEAVIRLSLPTVLAVGRRDLSQHPITLSRRLP